MLDLEDQIASGKLDPDSKDFEASATKLLEATEVPAAQAADEPKGEAVAAPADALKDEPKAATPPAGEKQDDPPPSDPKGVLTADGKNVIPYEVLKSTRAEAATLRAEKDALTKERDELLAKVGKPAAPAEPAKGKAARLDPEQFPAELVEAVNELNERLGSIEQREADVKGRADKAVIDAKASEAQATQADIDTVPDLAAWQRDPAKTEAWSLAVSIDKALQLSPKWKGKPQAERFAEVANRVRSELGLEPAKPTGDPKPPAKADAKTKVATPPQQKAPLTSLSDIPGGGTGPQSETENIEQMDAVSLEHAMGTMTDEQQNALLRKYA